MNVQLIDILYDTNILAGKNISIFTKDILPALKKLTQEFWLRDSIMSEWRNRFEAPFLHIFTKWGFCKNFNLLPHEQLINFNV
jgi:hypothetical protein